MKQLYNAAKKAKTGEDILCPNCNTLHNKATYHKVFCSNAKTRASRNCKDAFWNKVDPEKRNRQTQYFAGVDSDGSWDAHECSVAKQDEFGNPMDCPYPTIDDM